MGKALVNGAFAYLISIVQVSFASTTPPRLAETCGAWQGGGDAKRQKVGDRTRSMTSRGLPRIGRAKDLPCYKSVVGLIGGRNFGGLSTVEGKGAYRAMVKHAAGDEIERHAIDVLHRLEDVQCKTLQVCSGWEDAPMHQGSYI